MGTIDITLRAIVEKSPEDLVKGILAPGTQFQVGEWIESQLTVRERRLDKALKLKIADKEHLLHVEFQVEQGSNLGFRVYEYHSMLALAVSNSHPEPPPPIKSVVILLKGPQKIGPLQRKYQTSWSEEPFCGVHYTIDPIYLLSLEELEKRQSLLWLIFAPLTVNAEVCKIKELLERLEKKFGNKEKIAELAGVMAIVGTFNYKQQDISTQIIQWIVKELIMQTDPGMQFWEEIFKDRIEQEIKQGVEKGLEKGIEQGEKNSLFKLFNLRFGKPLTEKEKQLIMLKLARHGYDTLYEAILEISDKQKLRSWLTEPK